MPEKISLPIWGSFEYCVVTMGGLGVKKVEIHYSIGLKVWKLANISAVTQRTSTDA